MAIKPRVEKLERTTAERGRCVCAELRDLDFRKTDPMYQAQAYRRLIRGCPAHPVVPMDESVSRNKTISVEEAAAAYETMQYEVMMRGQKRQ